MPDLKGPGTFAELRHWLGFGVVRLKLLLAIQREACLDTPGWAGRFIADIGPTGQVKAAIEPATREVTLEGCASSPDALDS